MKNVFIYATCQGDTMQSILGAHKPFTERYKPSCVVRNYVMISQNTPIVRNRYMMSKLQEADVFIYQPLSDKYGEHSTSHMFNYLKDDVETVSMPYVVNDSLWPFIVAADGDTSDDWGGGEDKKIKNMEPVDDLTSQGANLHDILKMYDNDSIDWGYNERHKHTLEYLKNKEKDTDVRVVDYIKRNLSEKRMFIFFSHPSSDLSVYMANCICDKLGLPHVETEYEEGCFFPTIEQMMYPTTSVNHFDLRFVGKKEMGDADDYFRVILKKYIINSSRQQLW